MDRKYEITDDCIEFGRYKLCRIKALRDFENVKKGEFGGYIEKEDNLSHNGNAWVSDDAKVFGHAKVYDNAKVYGSAQVYSGAKVYGSAQVYSGAKVYGSARVYGSAQVYGGTRVSGDTQVYGNAEVYDYAEVYGNAEVYSNAKVYGNAEVSGHAKVYSNARVSGNAEVYGNAAVYDYAEVSGNAEVSGHAKVYSNARVSGNAEVYSNAIIAQHARIITGTCKTNLLENIKESIRCQTGLVVFNDKIIAYKQVGKDLCSFYDNKFCYEIGKIVEAKDINEDPTRGCGGGLHFSNANYWNFNEDILSSVFLVAEIELKDIIAVQEGKIRCRRAKIIGKYEIEE